MIVINYNLVKELWRMQQIFQDFELNETVVAEYSKLFYNYKREQIERAADIAIKRCKRFPRPVEFKEFLESFSEPLSAYERYVKRSYPRKATESEKPQKDGSESDKDTSPSTDICVTTT